MSLERGLNKLDILNLEWPNSDRDLHIVTPVLVYLSKKYKITYKTLSIFNGYYYILKYKPKMLVISNFQGASINNDLVKLVYNSGMKVITFISEGSVTEEASEEFLWGWNKEFKLFVDKMFLWSERSRGIFLHKNPKFKNKLVVSGATGFDRYKLLDFENKNKFLKDNNLRYKKIVGIAAWGFDHFFGDYYQKLKNKYLKIYGLNQIKMYKNDLYKLQDIYKSLIKNNPDILFLLRYHPGTIDFEKNEFYGLDNYDNVFISNKYQHNQYGISDLINISDLWIGYETTTAIESWLLNKQTFLINPTRSDFIRENVCKGSPIVQGYRDVQKYIDEFFKNNSIKDFESLQQFREAIIKDVIEYGDGKNHIRAAEEIIEVLNKASRKITYSFEFYVKALIQIAKLMLSKTIFRKRCGVLRYKKNFAKIYQELYEKKIDV